MTFILEKTQKLYSYIIKNPKRFIAAFFALILLTGILNFKSYGLSTDELTENDILLSNVKEYVHIFAGEEAVNKLNIPDIPYITEFHERDHGEAAYYLIAPLSFALKDNMNIYYTFKHLYTFLIFFGSLICLYLIIKNLTKRRLLGIVGVLMMFLSPRIFGESFYNVKDLVLMCLTIIMFYFGYKFVETKTFKYATFFAIASAFASNLRVIGFLLFVLILAMYFRMIKKSEITKKEKCKHNWAGIYSIVFFLIFFTIITPATWTSLLFYFLYTFIMSVNFFRWDGYVVYFDKVYNHTLNPLPWHYIPVLIAVTTPIITLILMVFGVFDTIFKYIKTKFKSFYEGTKKYYLLLLIFISAPLLVSIILKSNVYNGWRHFYFIYGALIILAVGGLKTLIDYKKKALNITLAIIISLQFILSGVVIAMNQGLQFAYFNPLATKVSDNFEMDYWNVSAANCLMKFLDTIPDEKVMISGIDPMGIDGLNHGIVILPEKYAKRIQIIALENRELFNVKYVLVNPSYHKQYQLQYKYNFAKNPAFDLDGKSELVTNITVQGNSIMEIYKLK